MLKAVIFRKVVFCLTAFLLFTFYVFSPATADKIKDIASVAGVRSNQLIGHGIVVGLNGSGDGNLGVTTKSLQTMINRFGMSVTSADLNPSNSASVIVTAEIPAFAKPGQKLDVTVSAFGKAESLRGGSLLLTPLKGANGQVYAVAQGNVAVGGLGIVGGDGSSLSVNIPTVGRISGGATVEAFVETPFNNSKYIILNLNVADFTTATRLSKVINERFGEGTANVKDAVTVLVDSPIDSGQKVALLSEIENMDVLPAEPRSKVVVNSRTGTIVMNSTVNIGPAAVSHGNLTVRIVEDVLVSQPEGNVIVGSEVANTTVASGGQTITARDSKIDVDNEHAPMFLFNPGVELSSIVDAVNAVGATPSDLIAILEALKMAGALRSELVIM